MKTSFLWFGLIVYLGFFVLLPQPSLAQELSLNSLIVEALKANPDLQAAKLRYEAFQAKVSQAGSLPNPMFQTTLSNISTDSWSLGKAPMSGIEYMFSQTIPFPGKLWLAKKSTKSLVQKTKEEYESTKNFILSQLKENYYQLFWLQKSIEITQENKQLLEDFSKITATRYSVGQGIQQDVLKAQVEVSKMIEELISLEEMRKTTCAKINVLLGRNPQDSLGKPEELSFQKVSYSEEELQNLAVQNNPALKGMEFLINASESDYRLARRGYWPDFTFSFSYLHMKNDASMDPSAEKDFVSTSVNMEIPLYFWSKQKKQIQEKGLDLKSSRQEYEGMKNDLEFDVSMLYYSLNKHEKEIGLYQTAILPQARQSLESAKSGYQVGKVDFLTLLDNQMTLYNHQIAYYQALSLYFQTSAKLEEATGKSLFPE